MARQNLKDLLNNKWTPLAVAVGIAIIVLAYYIFSGRGSLDYNVREFSHNQAIQKVDSTDTKNIVVTCKNGQIYKIASSEDQQNYDDMIFNACGEDSTQAVSVDK